MTPWNHTFNPPTCRQVVFYQSFCVRAIGVRGGSDDSGKILKNSGKTYRYVWASCLSRIIALQNFPIRFPHSGAKIRADWKFCPPLKSKVAVRLWWELSTTVCWVALLRVVIRRVTTEVKRGTIPWAPNDCGRRRKVLTMSQLLQCMYISFRKTSVSNKGAPNFLLAPGAISSSNSMLLCVIHVYGVRSCTIGHNSLT